MTEVLRFAVLGLGTGAIYAVLAQGLVLFYRGSGLLNFAQGALAMVGAYLYRDLVVTLGLPPLVGLLGAVVGCAGLGLLLHRAVLRPMRHSSPLSRVIATLGILLVLQSAAFLVHGHDALQVPSLFPQDSLALGGPDLSIGVDTLWIIGIGVLLTVTLATVYRRTRFGKLTTAVAENQLAAATLGHSPDRIAAVNWAVGSALAGLAGVLVAPIVYLEPTTLVLLVVPAMAAALVGGFTSFPVTLGAALLLGVAQSEIQRFVPASGWSTAVPFLVVLAILLARGRSLPLRDFVTDRLARVGDGRIRPIPVAVVVAVGAVTLVVADDGWVAALTFTMAYAVIALSIVVVTGYAGQLSLAQAILAGLGAITAARLTAVFPFPVALIVAALGVGLVGALVGAPALRTRGVTLAVVTLGLGAALADLLLQNPTYTGGVSGILIPTSTLFGLDLDPFSHPERYGLLVLAVLTTTCLAVANLRRGATGRRMLAVRSNERAAAAAGVHNAATKTQAFVLGAGIAAVGGVLLTFVNATVAVGETGRFDVLACIMLVAVVVTGGVGYVGGALLGALLISGGVVSHAFEGIPQIADYLPLVGGIVLLLNLVFSPDGLVEMNRRAAARLIGRLRRVPGPSSTPSLVPPRGVVRVRAAALRAHGLVVAFGGVRAVDRVDLEVRPGEVHGLIGPNGSGKTTIIDAVTGFVRPSAGRIELGETDLRALPARRRARAGLSRSFQSLELFDGLTVRENLAVAGEHPGARHAVTDLVNPGRVALTPAALEAVAQFGLADVLDAHPRDLSLGMRKAVAIARAVAAAPSVLLLDEPAAGLDEHEAAELAALVRRLADEWGMGVLLVEHRVDLVVSLCDRVTVLRSGAVLATGTPSEVIRDRAVVDAYLGTTPTPR